jgi:hypothetical protein
VDDVIAVRHVDLPLAGAVRLSVIERVVALVGVLVAFAHAGGVGGVPAVEVSVAAVAVGEAGVGEVAGRHDCARRLKVHVHVQVAGVQEGPRLERLHHRLGGGGDSVIGRWNATATAERHRGNSWERGTLILAEMRAAATDSNAPRRADDDEQAQSRVHA